MNEWVISAWNAQPHSRSNIMHGYVSDYVFISWGDMQNSLKKVRGLNGTYYEVNTKFENNI